MEMINFVKTDGQFGTKRVLGTFILSTHTNGRILVFDQNRDEIVGSGFVSVEDAVKAFIRVDEIRLNNK